MTWQRFVDESPSSSRGGSTRLMKASKRGFVYTGVPGEEPARSRARWPSARHHQRRQPRGARFPRFPAPPGFELDCQFMATHHTPLHHTTPHLIPTETHHANNTTIPQGASDVPRAHHFTGGEQPDLETVILASFKKVCI